MSVKIPQREPTSRFLIVVCPECNNEQTIFSHASRQVKCEACGKILSEPTGGRAQLQAEVKQTLE